jgi:hypothetical protein
MGSELSIDTIKELLASKPKRGGSPRKDVTEPRTIENWWKQQQHFVNAEDTGLVCMNVNCLDPKPGRVRVLADIKGRMCCRYCFLDGWLSGKEYD